MHHMKSMVKVNNISKYIPGFPSEVSGAVEGRSPIFFLTKISTDSITTPPVEMKGWLNDYKNESHCMFIQGRIGWALLYWDSLTAWGYKECRWISLTLVIPGKAGYIYYCKFLYVPFTKDNNNNPIKLQRPGNINSAMMKHGDTFYGHHTAYSPVVKINRFHNP